MKNKVIITMPAYNEEKTIGLVLKDIRYVMDKTNYSYELLVVDDGSIDDTVKIASNYAKVVSHKRNKGLAETFRTEMKESLKFGANIIVHTDSDGQYLAKDIPILISFIERGYDLVLGSRFKGKIEQMPFLKRLGNLAFSFAISQIIKYRITDGQTGFRAFTKDIAELPITSDHTYTQEQIIRAVKNKFKIKEVPVFFAKRGGGTISRLIRNPFEYAIKAWINIIRVYRDFDPLKFFGYVGCLFILIGVLMGVFIFLNVLLTGSVGGIPRVVLSALFLMVGLQIVLFGLLADMVKK